MSVRPKQMEAYLEGFIKAKMPVLITGRPGIGKSNIVEQVANRLGHHLIVSHPVVSDPTDYKGLPFVVKKGALDVAEFLPISDLRAIMEVNEPTIFFLDDMGQAPQSVQAALMQLVLARQVNGHKISDYVTFVAATNRRKDKSGVGAFVEALKSRFSIFELEPTLDDWVDWALHNNSIPIELISAVRFKPEWVLKWSPSPEIENTPNPRNMEEVGKMMNMGFEGPSRFPVFASRMGDAGATELIAFLDLYRDLPSPDQVARDPKGSPVPNSPGSIHAITGSLFGNVNEQNLAAFLAYMGRLPKEFQVLFARDMAKTDRTKGLIEKQPFTDWLIKNSDLIKDIRP